ncbi:class I SAM-dependent methyltransferase [Patescibacteria group bacterium]|nr:class I SAM-dependent methyltransferase [Patescibacteria group bacterium]
MKIIDGLKLKGKPAEIPDCSRNDIPQFCLDMGYKKGAEIGVYKGAFTKMFGEAGLEIYGVDPWMPYPDFDLMHENRKKRQEFLYEHTKREVDKYKNVKLIRKTSMEAVEDFEDESLDFVYIDGNHKFRYVAEDICEWSKKIRKGGMVSGHDYIHPRRLENRWDTLQVKFVVDAYILAHRINNWYLLGRQNEDPGESRDRFRSWLWIKA